MPVNIIAGDSSYLGLQHACEHHSKVVHIIWATRGGLHAQRIVGSSVVVEIGTVEELRNMEELGPAMEVEVAEEVGSGAQV